MRRDKLYGRAWRKARKIFLALNPLCVMCEKEGIIRPAVDVDHIKRHEGNQFAFWDENNWQGLCKFHHQSVKARIERSGIEHGCDINGIPLSKDHHWNVQKS